MVYDSIQTDLDSLTNAKLKDMTKISVYVTLTKNTIWETKITYYFVELKE